MVKKILIVGPSWIGDMMMAQSLFKRLKHFSPHCVIDILAPAWTLPLTERMPEIHQSFSALPGHGTLNIAWRFRMAKMLRKEHYDQAIILPNSWKSALIPWLACIPQRIGYRGEMRFFLLNDIRFFNPSTLPRLVDRYMALAQPALSRASLPKSSEVFNKNNIEFPSLRVDPHQSQQVCEKFKLSPSSRPILALCPGAEFGHSKRWPASYFAEIARHKLNEGWQVWLFGSDKEMAISHTIQNLTKEGCINLTGKTSLSEAIDLLSLCSIAISNDSGLMHIAAALDKPLIALYGSTDPEYTPPLNPKAKILRIPMECSPCFKRDCPLQHHRCMQTMTPQIVLNALENLKAA